MKADRSSLSRLITRFFVDHLEGELGRSPDTVRSYSQTFKMLLIHLSKQSAKSADKLTIEELTPTVILSFLAERRQSGNCVRSCNQRLQAIRSFFRFVGYDLPPAAELTRRVLHISGGRAPRALVDYLDEAEMVALSAALRNTDRWELRDRALIEVALTCGLRASELLSLRRSDVLLGAKPQLTVMGKGRRLRTLPLQKQTARNMREWLEQVPSSGEMCFINRSGDPLTRDGLAYILNKYVRMAASTAPSIANKRITPHTLRHTCAMTVLRITNDITQVALWLGHSSIQATEKYLHADNRDKLRIMKAHPALGIIEGNFKGRTPDIIARLTEMAGQRHRARTIGTNQHQ